MFFEMSSSLTNDCDWKYGSSRFSFQSHQLWSKTKNVFYSDILQVDHRTHKCLNPVNAVAAGFSLPPPPSSSANVSYQDPKCFSGTCFFQLSLSSIDISECKSENNISPIVHAISMDPNGYSEQQLVDCSKSNYGCDNGWYQRAWEYVALASGQDTSASYLYIATHPSCNGNSFSSSVLSTCAELKVPPRLLWLLHRSFITLTLKSPIHKKILNSSVKRMIPSIFMETWKFTFRLFSRISIKWVFRKSAHFYF